MTMTSTYDHRIIQGAESGRFLGAHRGLPAGRARLLRGRVRLARRGARPAATAAGPGRRRARPPRGSSATAPRAARAVSEELLQAVQAASTLVSRVPQPRPPGRAPGPARLRARGRPRPRSRGARPDAGDPGAGSRRGSCSMYVPGATLADALPHLRETYCGTIAYEIEHIASHRQRVWLREHIECGRLPPAARRATSGALAAQAPGRGRRARALHAQGLPRPAPVLDRGPGHDRADARRADPAVGGARRPGGRDRDGPPRPAERARAQPRPPLRHDLRRVRGRLDARGRDDDPAGRHGRRQVPPRHAGHLRAGRRRARSASTSSPTRATWSTSPRSSRAPRAPRRPRARARTPTRTPTRRCRS